MKQILVILSLSVLLSCNTSKNESGNSEMQDAAQDKASEMTDGASDAPVAAASATYKKYDIKSGIVSFETSMEMSGMVIKKNTILYFDEYGIKESKEDYNVDPSGNATLATRDFVKDGYRYVCSVEYGSGSKSKAMGYGVAAPFNMSEAATLKDNQYKVITGETISGKSCEGFSIVTPSGNMKMYGWNRVTMKTVLNGSSMKSETVATKIEENASIPADKFEVPKDVVMTDM